MRISIKENIELPQISRTGKLEISKDKDFIEPKLQRILYSPPSSPSRLLINMTILESMINKVNAFLSRNPTSKSKMSSSKSKFSNSSERQDQTLWRKIADQRGASESKPRLNTTKITKNWINY